MGGRGAMSGTQRNKNKVPKMKNPAGIPSNVMSEDDYLGQLGLKDISSGYTVDKLRGNRQLKTARGQKRFEQEIIKAENEYQDKRAKAIKDYQSLVNQGKIKPPTIIQKSLIKAHGNPDNASTQSARRMLEKRGIDWRTGKKIER